MNYNLLVEPWIPVLGTNGKFDLVGIRTALTESDRIRQIAASNPMDRVAILRFLLALLYWCKGNPSDDVDRNLSDSFPSDWFSKLDENHDCFNLLGDRKRFYQRIAYSGAKVPKKLSANYLIHEIPTGTNKWHFRHSTDKMDGLCPACCAMGLLRLPLFATSGGRGKPPGINAKPPFYVIPVGMSLAATLRFSWRPVSNLGIPTWENPDLQLPRTGEIPLLMGLTWLPRRVWLDNPEESEAVCISCGRKGRLVRLCVFDGIGSTKTGWTWHDPHAVYVNTSKGDVTSLRASDVLAASDAVAGQWTKVMAGMIPEQKALANRSSAWVVGFATVQNDKYLEAMECVIPLPCAPDQVQEVIERWQKEGSSLVRKARPPNEKTSSRRQHAEIKPAIDAIRPHVEGKVFAKAEELLAGGDAAWEQAASEYRPMMEMIAQSLSPGFTVSAVQRRHQIARVMPDMRQKKETDKKPGRKKGGDD